MNVINWFEIPANDFDRARTFYSAILDGELETSEMQGYKMAFLPMNNEKTGVGGAVVAGEGCKPSAEGSLVYLNGGDDLQTILSRVEPAGGKIIHQKVEITPEIGYMAIFLDTEGNRIGLHSEA